MSYANLIVNPAAGAGRTGRRLPELLRLLRKVGLRFEHNLTEAPGQATELAAEAVKKGYGLIVSVGGDGTINEVVNGLYQATNGRGVMLGIIGMGTGSDYIRTIGIPLKPEEACLRLLNPRKLAVDLGVVEYQKKNQWVKRLFVNFAGVGFDAEVVRKAPRFKALGSTPSYLVGLFTTFLSYRGKDVTIKLDGNECSHRVFTVIVSNGRYCGGKMKIAPRNL